MGAGEMQAPVAGDVAAAEERLRRFLRPTPLVWSEHRSAFLKLENLQVTGSYKVRGALNALLVQVAAGDRRPVVAASAGNHAQGVAWAARRLGLEARVVVPRGAPRSKVMGAAALGARVIEHGEHFEHALSHAESLARDRGWRLLPAFDDPDVIAGQGSIGCELRPAEPDVVLVPVGGGGLAAGVALAIAGPGTRIVGVQVEGVDGLARALGRLPELAETADTLADGVRVRAPGALTRRICTALLHEVLTVPEAEVRRTVIELAARDHVVAEGAGALAVAALPRVAGRRKVAVVSGGNIDLSLLCRLIDEQAHFGDLS